MRGLRLWRTNRQRVWVGGRSDARVVTQAAASVAAHVLQIQTTEQFMRSKTVNSRQWIVMAFGNAGGSNEHR